MDEGGGGVDQIGSLLLKDGEAIEVLGAMGGCGGGPISLLAGVENFEREDGEAVEHHAGGFGVELRGVDGFGQVMEEPLVDLLDKVVALLVEGVDGSLDRGDLGVGGEGIAGFVFFVPKSEVGAVLTANEIVELLVRCHGCSGGGEMPSGGPEDLRGGKVSQVRRLPCAGHRSNCISQRQGGSFEAF